MTTPCTLTTAVLVALCTGCYRSHGPEAASVDAGAAIDSPDARPLDAPSVAIRCLTLANPSFDDPPVANDESGAPSLPGWTITAGNVDVLVSGGAFGTGTDGADFIDLNGTEVGTIEQLVRTVPGAHYTFVFSITANAGTRSVELSAIGDTTLLVARTIAATGPVTPTPLSAWRSERFELTATSASTRIRFRSLSDDPVAGVMLDDIRCPPGTMP